ncbi:MAG: 8-oxo-dGTP diphosphatase MutT [Legionellales bacterium]|nr:8-oxo-dGTP diphosphatase MutT [Legionellales bacterium]
MDTSVSIPQLQVVVGLIGNAQHQVLIAQRPPGKMMAGLWEFPGGKVEANESHFTALVRELQEELGVRVLQAQAEWVIEQSYPDRHVILNVWQVTQFAGQPTGCEGQIVRWVTMDELSNYSFPIANQHILARLHTLEFS